MDGDCNMFFAQNTDITGIGVRIAFYLQTLNIVVQMFLSHQPDDLFNAFLTLTSMNVGLMLASIVSASRNQLSFFNAVHVQNLVCVAIASSCVVVWASLRHTWDSLQLQRAKSLAAICHRRRGIFDLLATVFVDIKSYRSFKCTLLMCIMFLEQFVLASVLIIRLWSSIGHFGPEPRCINQLAFYISFHRMSTSTDLAKVRSITMGTYFLLAFCLWSPLIVMLGTIALGAVLDKFTGFLLFCVPPLTSVRPPRLGWFSRAFRESAALSQVNLFGINKEGYLGQFVVSGYWVIASLVYIPSLELSLRQSVPSSSGSQWSFGQILALVSVAPSLLALLSVCGAGFERRMLQAIEAGDRFDKEAKSQIEVREEEVV